MRRSNATVDGVQSAQEWKAQLPKNSANWAPSSSRWWKHHKTCWNRANTYTFYIMSFFIFGTAIQQMANHCYAGHTMVSVRISTICSQNTKLPWFPTGPVRVAVDIDLVFSPAGAAGQDFHQDEEPQRQGLCPIRFHVCLPTSDLDAANGIEYRLSRNGIVALSLSPGELGIHTGSVWHRGLPNTTQESRCNVFLSYRPVWYNMAYVLGADWQ